jgi:hypothetical protein
MGCNFGKTTDHIQFKATAARRSSSNRPVPAAIGKSRFHSALLRMAPGMAS